MFSVSTDAVEFVEGETQQIVTVTSPTLASVAMTGISDGDWISLPAELTLTNASAEVAITIPDTQPAGSVGTAQFVSVQMPAMVENVLVTVVPEGVLAGALVMAVGALLMRRNTNQ